MRRQVIFVTAALLGGCGRDPDFACDHFVNTAPLIGHECTEIDHLEAAAIGAETTFCAERGGLVVASCTSTDDLGVCTITEDGVVKGIHFYSDFTITAAMARSECTKMLGAWTPS